MAYSIQCGIKAVYVPFSLSRFVAPALQMRKQSHGGNLSNLFVVDMIETPLQSYLEQRLFEMNSTVLKKNFLKKHNRVRWNRRNVLCMTLSIRKEVCTL